MPKPICPPLAADIVAEVGDKIVFIERKNIPHGWALPGGFVEVGETVEDAAVREAREETGLEVELRSLLGVYSRPNRDPRGHSVSVVYIGRATGEPRGGDDARAASLFLASAPPAPLAFDHAQILSDYIHFLKTGSLPLPGKHQ